MRDSSLNTKAMQNKEIAEECEKRKYFDVAVSRHYYEILLTMKNLVLIDKPDTVFSETDSHNDIWNKVKLIAQDKYEFEVWKRKYKEYQIFGKLKEARNAAEYDDSLLLEIDYNDEFKDNYRSFGLTLGQLQKKLCEGVKNDE